MDIPKGGIWDLENCKEERRNTVKDRISINTKKNIRQRRRKT